MEYAAPSSSSSSGLNMKSTLVSVLGTGAICYVCASLLLPTPSMTSTMYVQPTTTWSRSNQVLQAPQQRTRTLAWRSRQADVLLLQASQQPTPRAMKHQSSLLSELPLLGAAILLIPTLVWAGLKFIHQRAGYLALQGQVEPPAQHDHWAMAVATGSRPDERTLFRMTEEQKDVVRSMSDFAVEKIMPLANKPEKNWQPQDMLPDPEAEDFEEQVKALRERSLLLPDDFLVVLTGDMITEEALPTYMTMLNTLDITRDETGASQHPWAVWTRKWTAEENRHGDLLNKYLWLTGRVNMRAVEGTVQRLIGSGMNPQTDNNPYLGFMYTSFQERATKISHGNTARMAKQAGDMQLAKICGLIAADEGRHEQAYQAIVAELFRKDPNGAMLAFADLMKKQITMPAHFMDDGEHATKNGGRSLFGDFAAVAENMQVYTAKDYTDILEYLIKFWGIENMKGLSEEAQAAQDYLCKLPDRYRKLAARVAARKKSVGPTKFSWISNRELIL